MRDPRHRRFATKSKAPVETPPPAKLTDVEIPVLKEKEEEKKGAGAPWYSGSGSGAGGLVGGQGVARVGGSMVSRGFLARLAAGISNALGGSGTFLGGLFASAAGQWLVAAGLAAWGALMLAAAGKLMGGWGAAGTAAPGAPSLAGMSPSGIVIDAPKDRSLGYLAGANKGEILWDSAKGPAKEKVNDAAAPAEEKAPEAAKKDEPPPFTMPDVSQVMGAKGGLNADGFVKKMTSDVSQLHAGGAGAAPQIKDAGGFALKKTFDPKGSSRGSLGGMSKARRALSSSRLQKTQGRASRAMGQAKLANNMSLGGRNAETDSAARTYAADAFDQGKSIGGNLTGIGGDGMVVPPGNGAPDGVSNSVPDVGPGVNQTPYQNQVDNAKNAGDQAAALKNLGMMMLAIGAMLCALGMALMGNHTTFPIGYMLLGAGMALIAMGMMMLMMSGKQADAAKGQGKNIDNQYGQKDQGQIVDTCADQAANNGTKTDNCKAQAPQVDGRNTVHQDVETESKQTYSLDNGNGGQDPGPPRR